MVLHDNQAIRYSDRLIVMKDGAIEMMGEPREVITANAVKSIYGVDVVVKYEENTGFYLVPLGIS